MCCYYFVELGVVGATESRLLMCMAKSEKNKTEPFRSPRERYCLKASFSNTMQLCDLKGIR